MATYMDLERLNAFRAVADEQSFTRAAARLHKTQPAVSQAIKLLESGVGEPLFLRLPGGVRLTEAGRVLLEHAREAFHALEQARARLQSLRKLEHGLLRIGTSDTTACYVLPPVLRAFRDRYPGVELVLSNRPSPAILEHVATRAVDLGVVTLPVTRPGLKSRELTVREDVVICSRGGPFAGRKRVRLTELAAHPLLLLDKGARTRGFIDEQMARAGVAPRVAMELGSIEVIKRLVQLGFGVSIVPDVAVREEVKRGELCAASVFTRKSARRLGVVVPAEGGLSPAAREFLRALVAHFRPAATPLASPRRKV